MRRVVSVFKVTNINQLIERVQHVGQRLTAAQPKEIAVDNIVRRILGIIRDEAEEDREGESNSDPSSGSRPDTPRDLPRQSISSPLQEQSESGDGQHGGFRPPHYEAFQRPPLLTSHTSYVTTNQAPMVTSMFNLLSHPLSTFNSPSATPGSQSPAQRNSPHPSASLSSLTTADSLALVNAGKDLRAEVIDGIDEIIDELDIVDDQIASYALEHIHSNEIILTHGSSATVQKFLLKAASKRKFTLIHAEAYPNNHEETHSIITGKAPADDMGNDLGAERFSKPLIAAGITVVLIPDAAVFALMSRVNKVILGTHVVLANGGLIAAAGAKIIAKAAQVHRTPVVVVAGVYKLSPIYPFDFDAIIEYGDGGKVCAYGDDELAEKVDVENPLHDYVPAELVDLYITNL